MAPRAGHAAGPRRSTSLIEVLIALLLLSVGMLGMIGLKASSLKYAGQSNGRAAAAIYAVDLLDRMRANPVRAVAGEYNLAIGAAAPATPTTVAQVDLVQWRQRIAESLPGGSGSVAVATDSTVRVVLQWNERTDQATPAQLSYTFEARL
jgi:type IV pilus assembly protein PilV